MKKLFAIVEFDNYKKAHKFFRIHDTCDSHPEVKLKWPSFNNTSIREQFNSKCASSGHRNAELVKLEALTFLLQLGIALHEHSKESGSVKAYNIYPIKLTISPHRTNR